MRAAPRSGSGSLESLIRSPELRARFGAGGRAHVESRYCDARLPGTISGIAGAAARRGAGMKCVAAGSRYPSRHARDAYFSDPESLHLARGTRSGLRRVGQLRERAAGLVRVLADPPNSCCSEALDEDAYYGFLSPKFRAQDQLELRASCASSFSAAEARPRSCCSAPAFTTARIYLNVFEHGDAEHPGLKHVAQRLFERLGCRAIWTRSCPIRAIPCIRIISSPSRASGGRGSRSTSRCSRSRKLRPMRSARRCARRRAIAAALDVQMKIFIMERDRDLAADVTDRSFAARVRDPFVARSRHLQAARRHRVRCAENRLCHAGAGAVQGCIPVGSGIAQILESAGPAGRRAGDCGTCGRPCAFEILLAAAA